MHRSTFKCAIFCGKGASCLCEKVSTRVSLRTPRRLTWAETFAFRHFYFAFKKTTIFHENERVYDFQVNPITVQTGIPCHQNACAQNLYMQIIKACRLAQY